MRTFGVEEELLLVDAATLEPLPAGEWAVDLQGDDHLASGHRVAVELQQEQIEVISPPQTTVAGQLEAIRTGRALAEQAALRVGGRVAALPTAPGRLSPHPVPGVRYRRIGEQFGIIAAEQLLNGFHIHVGVESRNEAVSVLDRIRVWLPTLLALSANSPFWSGRDTGYASYRYQAWSRWPTAGPTEIFRSPAGYDRHRAHMLDTGVPLDSGMLYYDARLCEHQPTLEVRIADVCLDVADAAALAALVRALVETSSRDGRWPVPEVPASLLRTWSWLASRSGVEGQLIDPATGAPAPAGDVVFHLLDYVRPVLAEYGEEATVETAMADILRRGTGAQRQRHAYEDRREARDVVADALEVTHAGSSLGGTAGLVESGTPEESDRTGASPADEEGLSPLSGKD
ncbi:glutamate--cysteine ligase [Citricoccus alkalitolerans]|uniref:Putative glutamate--cysteine ligase 2 n=1 Tax=Citricoccus alkalitolerans TaxID=246603 RepID=A0ABV8XZD5_9MICC